MCETAVFVLFTERRVSDAVADADSGTRKIGDPNGI